MNNREACIILNLICGVGYTRFKALCDKFGSPKDIFNISYNDLAQIQGIGEKLADKICNYKKHVDIEKELKFTQRADVQITTICDDNYPPQLKEISDPPLCLYIRGQLNCHFNNSIAVVGSRRITTYGREMAECLVSGLAYSDWTIVSGLAYGIDAISHQATVDANGRTIAVLGGGLARLHPQDHAALAREIIAKGGAVISEFPMEFPPTRQTFPMRNRIISGLSSAILVIEAGFKSGSLITANFALEQGRQVFAVPGRANSPQSRGCNKLIKEGAVLTENIDDILNEFEFLPNLSMNKKKAKTEEKEFEMPADLSQEEQRIIDWIKLEEKSIDQISAETEIPVQKLLAILLKLEIKKIITQLPGKHFKLNT